MANPSDLGLSFGSVWIRVDLIEEFWTNLGFAHRTVGTKNFDAVALIADPDFASTRAKVSSFFLGQFLEAVTG